MKLDHLKPVTTSQWGYMEPTAEMVGIWENIGSIFRGNEVDINLITEIGFHAGHSTTYLLEQFPNAHVETYGVSTPSTAAADTMKQIYGGRFQFRRKDSRQVGPDAYTNVDLHVVDSNHAFVNTANDILLGLAWGCKYMLIDNYDLRNVAYIADRVLGKDKIVKSYPYEATWNGETKTNVLNLYAVNPYPY